MSFARSFMLALNRLMEPALGLHLSSARYAVLQSRLAGLSQERQIRQLLYQQRLVDQIAAVDGDIVECGVGLGRSLLFWALLDRDAARGRRIWGFDSFEGFPEPTAADRGTKAPAKGRWNHTSTDQVSQLLELSGIPVGLHERPGPGPLAPTAAVTLVTGFFDQTLALYPPRPIALLHIDSDLYESYREPLVRLYPLVAPGGIVAFDEYEQDDKWPGARKAIDEYFGERTAAFRVDPRSGKYYHVKPAAAYAGAER